MVATPSEITRDELNAKIDGGGQFTLAEALPPRSYEQAHLPGAVNLPLDELETLASRLMPDKNAEIVTYCSNRECENSHEAAAALTKLGYTNVRRYAAGKQDWIAAGLPTETAARSSE